MTDNVHPSRDATAPELCQPPRHSENRRRPKREAKRRKAHANHLPRNISKRRRLLRYRRQVYANLRNSSAARLRAIFGGALAFRRFDRGSRRDSHPCSTPGHASWDLESSGHYPPCPVPVSDSTSRLGRNTEGNDAQSRSGAGCEPARKHRTRSTLQIASGMRPSMSEIFRGPIYQLTPGAIT